eukprot:COSAG05_NODE_1299_length_5244_cov_93.435180_3_plen_290_part_00
MLTLSIRATGPGAAEGALCRPHKSRQARRLTSDGCSVAPACHRRLAHIAAAVVAAPTPTAAAPAAATGVDRFSLNNKIALITAGSGDLFGSSVTEALAEAGATVLTASRSLERNEEYAASMRAQGFQAKGYQLDIASVESIAALRQQIIADFGRVDILVNNALARDGHGRDTSAGDVTATAENAARVAAGDFVGLFELCNQFIPEIQRNGGGSIINSALCPRTSCARSQAHILCYCKGWRLSDRCAPFSLEHIRCCHPGPTVIRGYALLWEAEPNMCVASNGSLCTSVF